MPKTIKKAALVGIAAALMVASLGAAALKTALAPRREDWSGPRRHVDTPEEIALMKAFNRAWTEGQDALTKGEWSRAEAAFRKGIKLKPYDDLAYAELGHVYRRSGRGTEARKAYEEALRERPRRHSSATSDPCVLASYGDLLLADGDAAAAVGAYRATRGNDYSPGSPTTIPQGESLEYLRITAHGLASIECRGGGDEAGADFYRWTARSADSATWYVGQSIGSSLKRQGDWTNKLDQARSSRFLSLSLKLKEIQKGIR